jgi:hypothetical protein
MKSEEKEEFEDLNDLQILLTAPNGADKIVVDKVYLWNDEDD